MHADMLCCVITETANTHLNELVYKLHVIFLEERVLSVDIRKSADALKSTLRAVVIVSDALESLAVEHLLTAADSLIELVCDKVDVECGMVRKYVHKDSDIVFLCRVKHGLHLFFCADDIISYSPIGGLIIMIPVSLLLVENLDVSAFRAEACIHRRGLQHGEAGIGNLLHVLCDSREVPAPYMEDGLCISAVWIMCHSVDQTVVLRCAGNKASARNDGKNSFHNFISY